MKSLSLACFALLITAGFLRAQNAPTTNAAPELGVREAAPAFVDEVTFKADSSGEKHTLVVINAPSMTRIDAPDDRFSILYNPATQYYIGLEMSNYTYWEFSWPVVRKAVEGTSRYATRLRDMGPELMEEDAVTPPATSSVALTGTEADPTDSVGGDDSGYVWRTTIEKKQIAGFTCQHWIGETVAGETIDAWCTAGLQPPLERAIATLKEINEPMALVPVRELVPPLVFVAWSTLTKGGVTPIEMKWGGDADASRFAFVSAKQREGKVSYFQIPNLYRRTTLLSMDGIANQKATETQHAPNAAPSAIEHYTPLPTP